MLREIFGYVNYSANPNFRPSVPGGARRTSDVQTDGARSSKTMSGTSSGKRVSNDNSENSSKKLKKTRSVHFQEPSMDVLPEPDIYCTNNFWRVNIRFR